MTSGRRTLLRLPLPLRAPRCRSASIPPHPRHPRLTGSLDQGRPHAATAQRRDTRDTQTLGHAPTTAAILLRRPITTPRQAKASPARHGVCSLPTHASRDSRSRTNSMRRNARHTTGCSRACWSGGARPAGPGAPLRASRTREPLLQRVEPRVPAPSYGTA